MKAKTVKEVLIATRYIINSGWCQGTYYQDENNNYVGIDIDNKEAALPMIKSCCLSGALHLVEVPKNNLAFGKAYNLVIKAVGDSIARWNDGPTRTKEQVLNLLDKLIASLS